ncbi:MAG: hypothetical protein RBQ99_11190, partial [Trichlorobacter sp.]|nr:hypothetical protein [Trichlorobacter sp.]
EGAPPVPVPALLLTLLAGAAIGGILWCAAKLGDKLDVQPLRGKGRFSDRNEANPLVPGSLAQWADELNEKNMFDD